MAYTSQSNLAKQGFLITGASTGIGEACARTLYQKGYTVFAGVRKEADGEQFFQSLAGKADSPQRLIPVLMDVTQPETFPPVHSRIETFISEGGRLKGLVNNAGIALAGPMEFIPMADLRHQLEVNFFGQVAVTQAFLPLLREKPAGSRIVMMSSISGVATFPFLGPYTASKHALEAVSDALRMELKPFGIKVSIIQPGTIKTPIWQKSFLSLTSLLGKYPKQAFEWYEKPFHKLSQFTQSLGPQGIPPQKVADAVAHALLSKHPKSRYLVGTDAWLLHKFYHLPNTWWDALILKRIGLE
ncbi:MAG: SDR family oxidoreductase [Cyanobacteria bacterium]|nr:SDR family oxidoreductase [Cyanobacteriota bacterium]